MFRYILDFIFGIIKIEAWSNRISRLADRIEDGIGDVLGFDAAAEEVAAVGVAEVAVVGLDAIEVGGFVGIADKPADAGADDFEAVEAVEHFAELFGPDFGEGVVVGGLADVGGDGFRVVGVRVRIGLVA